jgi:hypothetical protein
MGVDNVLFYECVKYILFSSSNMIYVRINRMFIHYKIATFVYILAYFILFKSLNSSFPVVQKIAHIAWATKIYSVHTRCKITNPYQWTMDRVVDWLK